MSPVLRALGPGEEGDIAARLVAVPERHAQGRTVAVAGDTDHPYVRLGEELLTLLLGHLTGRFLLLMFAERRF